MSTLLEINTCVVAKVTEFDCAPAVSQFDSVSNLVVFRTFFVGRPEPVFGCLWFLHMPVVDRPANQPGDYLVDYEEKVFPDVKAEPGEKALVTFHTVAFEGSIGLVNLLQASRLITKGFETSVLLYGPGVTLGVMRGFPKLGDAAFDGHLNFNARLQKFMDQGGKVYACRFALQALYGHSEKALMPGITPVNPLDVLDIVLMHRKEGAFILDTWTL